MEKKRARSPLCEYSTVVPLTFVGLWYCYICRGSWTEYDHTIALQDKIKFDPCNACHASPLLTAHKAHRRADGPEHWQ